MGIRAKFTIKDINDGINLAIEEVWDSIVEVLNYVGLEAVKTARDEHERNYTDQTGNLRASIGYVIAFDGNVINEYGFDPNAAKTTKKKRDGITGASEGRQAAFDAIKGSKGYILSVTAGMEYGGEVEKRQYNVLTFTAAQAEETARQMLQQYFVLA